MDTSALFNTHKGYDDLPLRLGAGIIFAAHGAQKLFGWFGGYGIAGTGQWMESIGLAPGALMAALAGSAEFFGGIALKKLGASRHGRHQGAGEAPSFLAASPSFSAC